MKVVKSGMLTTVQDLGRFGYQKHGVIASGVMDPEAHRIANLLVGNNSNSPTLEITLVGPELEFQEDALISICGGNSSPMIDGSPVGLWRPIYIKAGSELRFGNIKEGCRSYLAVAGGYAVPEIMNSTSTYLRAGIGGYEGRALQKNDLLSTLEMSEFSSSMLKELKEYAGNVNWKAMDWYVATEFIPKHADSNQIRVMKGREFDWFTKESQTALVSEAFSVDTKSDRMGYRLKGVPLKTANKQNMISEAVAFGTVQVPSEGNPIVLLADRQTTGGYPKIAQVASVDLPKMAQLKPGEKIKFTMISHEDAQQLFLERERLIQQLAQGIKLKYR
ncbi:biotin-dependent carboxyltransferase family protein [Halobacillus salinarum]|uniref:Biotin-dependent carboxyltransferase family protein n=1 Tax=Halobacillus salinarum TaxID=2932257 RepID=A0ABY4ERM1_9BACI|nr:biotin-dependent carboxyltransferase family protein [Halobacillus salinarum]